MITKRKMRRISGFLSRFLPDSLLRRVVDPRNEGGQLWKSPVLLRTVLFSLMAGCKGKGELEELTADLAPAVRRRLGVPRRLPDTTLNDFLCAVDPHQVSELLSIVGYDAWRRKALHQDPELPWGVLSLDGKYPTVRDVGESKKGRHQYLQVHHDKAGQPLYGTVRTVTAVLISAAGRPILGATPVPGDTNEVGYFRKAFGEMVRMYGRLFRVVMYDAGGASHENIKAVKAAGKDAIMQIANPDWVMYQTIELLMREKQADFVDEELVSQSKRVVRHVTVLPIKPLSKDPTIWEEVRTAVKVYSETYEDGECTGTKTRYFVSTLESTELTPEGWLRIIVKRWGVESAHQILDTTFAEDKRPWITSDAQGALVVMLLRRVAYTILALFKFITQRGEENRLEPWRRLMECIKDVLKWASDEVVTGFRPRKFAVPPALA